MTLYNGVAVMEITYVVDANDEQQAKEFVAEAAFDEFDREPVSVKDIRKVKI